MGSPTMNIGKIQGGRQPNIVPEKCFAELDFRLLTEEQKKQVEEIIKVLGEKYKGRGKFSMETLSYKRPLISNLEDRFVKTFLEVAEQVTGKPQNPRAAAYCTDLPTLFPERVVPFILFGPGSIKQAHQPDEFISLESLSKSIAIFEEFLLRAIF
jgi:acetylornithine deacetylase/succinyl-diaminopimelate desuccinylase-like protein